VSRGGLADVGEDLGDGLRIGEERDKGEGRLTGWTDEGKHLVDPGQEGGPFGGPAGVGSGGWSAGASGFLAEATELGGSGPAWMDL
jgi:hypothetical protein